MKLKFIYFFLLPLFGCKEKREITITGFAWKNEIISIYNENNNEFFSMRVDDKMKNEDGLSTLYYYTNIYVRNKDIKLRVILDSANINLMDTIVLIPSSNNEPYILFGNPKYSNQLRTVEVYDDANFNILEF